MRVSIEQSPPPGPPRGWYPDPAVPGRERLWDGLRWSDQVRLPLPPDASAPGQAPAGPYPGAGPGTYGSYGQVPSGTQPSGPRLPDPRGPQLPGQPSAGPGATPVARGLRPVAKETTTSDGVPLAPYGRRVAGFLIDHVLVSFLAALVTPFFVTNLSGRLETELGAYLTALRTSAPTAEPSAELEHLLQLMTIGTAVTMFVYGVVCLLTLQGSLGQRVMGLKVAPFGRGKEKLPPAQAVLRTLIWTTLVSTSVLALVQLFNLLLPLWQRRRQGIQDLLSFTQVVRR